MKKVLFLSLFVISLYSQSITSSLTMDWSDYSASLTIVYPFPTATRPLPSVRQEAMRYIEQNLNMILKEAISDIQVDSSQLMGDIIQSRDLFIIEDFVKEHERLTYMRYELNEMVVELNLEIFPDFMQIFKRHTGYYLPRRFLNFTIEEEYTGLIIYAAEELPVYGEDGSDFFQPAIFPKIYTENMNLFYEKLMTNPNAIEENGLVAYTYSLDGEDIHARVGDNPLRIIAKGVFGVSHSDLVISDSDAAKILALKENLSILEEARVAIILPKP